MEFKSDWLRAFYSIFILNLFRRDHYVACGIITSKTVHSDTALLIVSYDAFRPEYFDRNVTPYMNKLRNEGTSAEFLHNVFPTKTFVNHHTIATVSLYCLSFFVQKKRKKNSLYHRLYLSHFSRH